MKKEIKEEDLNKVAGGKVQREPKEIDVGNIIKSPDEDSKNELNDMPVDKLAI